MSTHSHKNPLCLEPGHSFAFDGERGMETRCLLYIRWSQEGGNGHQVSLMLLTAEWEQMVTRKVFYIS